MVIISVEDNGQGIAPADLFHVSDKFYRGDPVLRGGNDHLKSSPGTAAGVWLGLYLAKHIIDQFMGDNCRDKLTGGTVFTVFLPVSNSLGSFESRTEENASVKATVDS